MSSWDEIDIAAKILKKNFSTSMFFNLSMSKEKVGINVIQELKENIIVQ